MNIRGLFILVIGLTNFLTFIYSILVALYFSQDDFIQFMSFTCLSGSLPLIIPTTFSLCYYKHLSKYKNEDKGSTISHLIITSEDFAKKYNISLKKFYILIVPCMIIFILLSLFPSFIYHHYFHPLKPLEALAMVIIAYINVLIFAIFMTYIEFSGKWVELL